MTDKTIVYEGYLNNRVESRRTDLFYYELDARIAIGRYLKSIHTMLRLRYNRGDKNDSWSKFLCKSMNGVTWGVTKRKIL